MNREFESGNGFDQEEMNGAGQSRRRPAAGRQADSAAAGRPSGIDARGEAGRGIRLAVHPEPIGRRAARSTVREKQARPDVQWEARVRQRRETRQGGEQRPRPG